MNKFNYLLIFVLGCLSLSIQQSCMHDPFILDDIDPDPVDTTGNTIDTTVIGMPCDPDIIYFQNDILPILQGSCGIIGCHDAITATEDVVLDNYENVMATGEVVPFNLSESELYEVITEEDLDDVMPPTERLDNESISKIAQWILQGAKNNECDDMEECITTDVSYAEYVKKVMNVSCNGCHSSTVSSGGIVLDNYQGVLKQVNNGKLFGSISWAYGYENMPKGQNQLDSCTIAKIKSWIDDGSPDN